MTIAAALKALGELIASLWERGALLLWCTTTACAVVLIALAGGTRWHLGEAELLLTTYGTGLTLATLVLAVFSIFKTYSERTARKLVLIVDEQQSHWSHSRQPSGEVITAIGLRFQATNLSDHSIKLSAIRLIWPWVRRWRIIHATLTVQHPQQSVHSSEYPILAHSLTHGSAHIMIARPVGRVGKPMRIVVRIQDHAGRWHTLFPHVRTAGLAPR